MNEITNGVPVPAPTKYSGRPLPNMRLWSGPNEIRDVLIDKLGVEWVASYLDQSDWEAATRTIIPNHTFAFKQMRARASHMIEKMALKLIDPRSNGIPRHPVEPPEPPMHPRRRHAAEVW